MTTHNFKLLIISAPKSIPTGSWVSLFHETVDDYVEKKDIGVKLEFTFINTLAF